LVRPYTLNATFTPNAPQPGQGKVPSSAGAFDKTVVSNGVVNHYYKNGYLTVQPSGEASWYSYGTGNAIGVIEISAVPLPFEMPPDYAGNLPNTARDIGTLIGTQTFHDVIDRNDRFDYYKFNITSESKVDFALSGKMGNTGFYLFQDWYFNSDDSTHIDIISGTPPGVVPEFSETLKPGTYYVLVHKPKDYDGDEYDLKLSAIPLGDPDGNDSIQTAEYLAPSPADFGDGIDHKAAEGSIGGNLDREDYYRFTLDKISDVDIQLSGDNANAKFYLAKDINGNGKIDYGEGLQWANQDANTKKISRSLSPGTYYVVVNSDDRVNPTKYNLNVDTKPETAGNSPSAAQDIGVLNGSQTLKGLVDTKADVYDYYRFKLDEPGNVSLKLDKLIATSSSDSQGITPIVSVELMNANTQILASIRGDSSSAAPINGFLQPGYYYVRVNSTDTNGYASYELTLDGEPAYKKAIDAEYARYQGLLGSPTTGYWPAADSPNGTKGYGQNYDDGHVFWTAQSGAIALWHGFAKTYNQNGGSNGWLGFPTKGKETDSSGGQRIDFEGGYIYWTEKEGAKAYHPWETPQQNLNNTVGYDGANTHQTYVNTFSRNGGLSALGSPTGNVHRSVDNGYVQEFSGGSEGSGAIMKSGANDNSYWVGGAFWAAYQDAVSQGKNLGYPTSDRYEVNGVWRQDFQSGARISTQPSNNNYNNNSPIDGMTPYEFGHLGNLDDTLSEVAARELGNSNRWVEIRKLDGSTYTDAEARQIQRGTIVYLPKSSGNNNNTDGGTGNTGGSNNNNTLPVQPADFTKALAFNLRWEGEYSNHPSDPGGATNKGITQNTYNAYRSSKGLSTQDVRGITDGEVRDIYYTNYWIASGSNQLTSRLAMVHFDTAVNMGTTASRLLQQARQSANGDEMSVVRRYLDLREAEYRAIVASKPSMGVFLNGWLNRLNSLRAEVGATGGSSNNNNGGNNNTGGSLGQLGYVGIGVTPIDDSSDNRPPKNSLELGLNSLSWTKQRLEELEWLINNGNQFEVSISSDPDNLLLKKFGNRPGTGKEFNYGEYIRLKGLNYRLKNAIDFTTKTDDLIEDYIDSIADSEDSDTALKLYNLKQSWESGRKQAQESIQQKLSWVNYPWLTYFLENLAEGGRIIFQSSAKAAFHSISAYLRIRALINGGPLAKLSSYYSKENYWQRQESERISKDLGKLADGLGWVLSDKLGELLKATDDITKAENFSKLASVVSAIGGDIMGWMDKNRVSGIAGLSGDLKGIVDEYNKIGDIDKILTAQSGIYLDEDDKEFLNAVKFFSSAKLMSAAFSWLLNLSKLAGVNNDILNTIESSIKIFNDANVIIEEGYNVMSRGEVRNSYDLNAWYNELYNSQIKIDKEYITGVAEVLGDYVAK
jgi:hypothetical protein